MNYSEDIMELVDSWINGNRSYVRDRAKKMSKVKLARLTLAIAERDSAEQAHKFVDGL